MNLICNNTPYARQIPRKHQGGFTLVETLLYIGLFGIIIVGIVSSAYVFFESGDRNLTKTILQAETDFLVAKIDNALDGAQTVSVPAANASGAALLLTKYDGTTAAFSLSGDVFSVDNGSGPVPLNGTNVMVTDVRFIHLLSSGGSQAQESIEAGLSLAARMGNGMVLIRNASTTRYIRK